MFKKILPFTVILIFSITGTFGQTAGEINKLEGEWQFLGEKEYVKVSGQSVFLYKQNNTGGWELQVTANNRKISSLVLGNTANLTVIENMSKSVKTLSHSINLFYVSPFVIAAHDVSFSNAIDSTKFPEESWSWGTESKSSQTTLFDIMFRRIQKVFKISGSMASTSPYIKLDTVFNTSDYTAVKFTVSNKETTAQNFTLNPPGHEHAFSITADNGKTYSVLGEYGFGGFASYQFQPKDKLVFYVFFERIPDTIKRITLREGNCTEGCWNFYDVNLN